MITPEQILSFQPSKSFRYHQNNAPVTSLDFDDSGQFLISSGADSSMQLYDCFKGKHVKSVLSKKYGTHLAKFTHHSKNCIYVSTKESQDSHAIRYLSLYDNTYIRYFKGHKGLVTSMEMSPINDTFISCSVDDSCRVWDLRTSNCQGYLNCKGPSLVAFDPTGSVFAIASSSTKKIGLYDTKSFHKEPFAVFDLAKAELDPLIINNFIVNKLEFSNDGAKLLVGTNNESHYILDAFDGNLLSKLKGHDPMKALNYPDNGQSCFTPDSRYVFGSGGVGKLNLNRLLVWDTNQSLNVIEPTKAIISEQVFPRLVLFNPKLMMLATADTDVTMWLPSEV